MKKILSILGLTSLFVLTGCGGGLPQVSKEDFVKKVHETDSKIEKYNYVWLILSGSISEGGTSLHSDETRVPVMWNGKTPRFMSIAPRNEFFETAKTFVSDVLVLNDTALSLFTMAESLLSKDGYIKYYAAESFKVDTFDVVDGANNNAVVEWNKELLLSSFNLTGKNDGVPASVQLKVEYPTWDSSF